MDDLIYESATKIADQIRKKEVSSVEVVSIYFDRIDSINPLLNSVVQTCPERALSEAKLADKAISEKLPIGPLHGVPFTLKDSLNTKGIVSAAGTSGRSNFIPEKDATVTSRLRKAGGILLGKTNTPEFTLAGETDNLVYGRTNNPYNTKKMPGGSSGGSAATVAAGGSPLDIGSDTRGSIRLPAHFCGIAGLKPNSGRIPRTGHIVDYTMGALDSLTQNGPMARYVEDLALILPIISGPDWLDPAIVDMPLGDPKEVDIKDLRIAFYTDNKIQTPSDDIQEAVCKSVKILEDAGAYVEEALPHALTMIPELDSKLLGGDDKGWLKRLIASSGTEDISPFIQNRLKQVDPVTTSEFTQILEDLDRFRSEMLAFMKNYDAIITPTAPFVACDHGQTWAEDNKLYFIYTSAYNMTGWPGAVVRVADSEDGLPIGIQIISRPWREDVALAIALHIEKITGGWKKPNI
jgi:amidase